MPVKQITTNENAIPLFAANKKTTELLKGDAVPVDQFKAFYVYEDVTNLENEKPTDNGSTTTETASVALAAIRYILII